MRPVIVPPAGLPRYRLSQRQAMFELAGAETGATLNDYEERGCAPSPLGDVDRLQRCRSCQLVHEGAWRRPVVGS
jgi:hypothetical protein